MSSSSRKIFEQSLRLIGRVARHLNGTKWQVVVLYSDRFIAHKGWQRKKGKVRFKNEFRVFSLKRVEIFTFFFIVELRFLHFFIPMVYNNIIHNSQLFTVNSYNAKNKFENNCKPKFYFILFNNGTSNFCLYFIRFMAIILLSY